MVSKSIGASCQKYHDTAIHHCLKVLEPLVYIIESSGVYYMISS